MGKAINGFNQAAEFLGYKCSDNEEYAKFVQEFTGILYDHHKQTKGGCVGPMGENSEFVPKKKCGHVTV